MSLLEAYNFDYENSEVPNDCEMVCNHKGPRHNFRCHVSFKVNLPKVNGKLPVFTENTKQVHKLRYNSELKVWQGYVDECYGTHSNTLETLPNQWVTQNFSATFLNNLKKRSETDTRFVRIPPGAPRSSCVVPERFFHKNAQKIQYMQGLRYTCASDSFSSALYYMKLYELASDLSVEARKNHKKKEGLDLIAFVCEYCSTLSKTKQNFCHERLMIGIQVFLIC